LMVVEQVWNWHFCSYWCVFFIFCLFSVFPSLVLSVASWGSVSLAVFFFMVRMEISLFLWKIYILPIWSWLSNWMLLFRPWRSFHSALSNQWWPHVWYEENEATCRHPQNKAESWPGGLLHSARWLSCSHATRWVCPLNPWSSTATSFICYTNNLLVLTCYHPCLWTVLFLPRRQMHC
jgi:hypothetical protein